MTPDERPSLARRALRAAPFVVAALIWTAGAFLRTLWQDEFHSLFHATSEGVLGLLASVRSDNHPPLSFLLQQASCALLGESAFALRLPSVLVGLAALAVYLRLARRLEEPAARAIAPWLAVGSSYFFWLFTSARMYALVMLAVLGLLASALAALERRRSPWWITAWIALGLHSHYCFFHVLALLGLASVALLATTPALRAHARRFVLPGLAGLALFAPWAAYAFVHQLGTGAPPTATYHGFRIWSEAQAHFFFLNSSAGGRFVYYGLAVPGVLAAVVLAVCGSARFARMTRSGDVRRAFAVALLVLGLLGPTWSYLAAAVHVRSGFHLKYLAGFAPAALLIVAAGTGAGAPWRQRLGWFLVTGMFAATLANVVTPGREDVRGAVSYILDHAQPGDAVIVRPWWYPEPERSPTDFGWYAERLAAGREGPAQIPLERIHEAPQHPRVWMIEMNGMPRWVSSKLERHFSRLETPFYSPDASVFLYSEPRAGGS